MVDNYYEAALWMKVAGEILEIHLATFFTTKFIIINILVTDTSNHE